MRFFETRKLVRRLGSVDRALALAQDGGGKEDEKLLRARRARLLKDLEVRERGGVCLITLCVSCLWGGQKATDASTRSDFDHGVWNGPAMQLVAFYPKTMKYVGVLAAAKEGQAAAAADGKTQQRYTRSKRGGRDA